jgi:hypothetical protein
MAWSLGLMVEDLGLGFRAWDLGLGVSNIGFSVQG